MRRCSSTARRRPRPGPCGARERTGASLRAAGRRARRAGAAAGGARAGHAGRRHGAQRPRQPRRRSNRAARASRCRTPCGDLPGSGAVERRAGWRAAVAGACACGRQRALPAGLEPGLPGLDPLVAEAPTADVRWTRPRRRGPSRWTSYRPALAGGASASARDRRRRGRPAPAPRGAGAPQMVRAPAGDRAGWRSSTASTRSSRSGTATAWCAAMRPGAPAVNLLPLRAGERAVLNVRNTSGHSLNMVIVGVDAQRRGAAGLSGRPGRDQSLRARHARGSPRPSASSCRGSMRRAAACWCWPRRPAPYSAPRLFGAGAGRSRLPICGCAGCRAPRSERQVFTAMVRWTPAKIAQSFSHSPRRRRCAWTIDGTLDPDEALRLLDHMSRRQRQRLRDADREQGRRRRGRIRRASTRTASSAWTSRGYCLPGRGRHAAGRQQGQGAQPQPDRGAQLRCGHGLDRQPDEEPGQRHQGPAVGLQGRRRFVARTCSPRSRSCWRARASTPIPS